MQKARAHGARELGYGTYILCSGKHTHAAANPHHTLQIEVQHTHGSQQYRKVEIVQHTGFNQQESFSGDVTYCRCQHTAGTGSWPCISRCHHHHQSVMHHHQVSNCIFTSITCHVYHRWQLAMCTPAPSNVCAWTVNRRQGLQQACRWHCSLMCSASQHTPNFMCGTQFQEDTFFAHTQHDCH